MLCPQFSLQLQDEGEESEARRGEGMCLCSWTEDMVWLQFWTAWGEFSGWPRPGRTHQLPGAGSLGLVGTADHSV